ncbi:hypothetical protein BH24ACT5_BH24ACT5_17360 [soil metagenome]
MTDTTFGVARVYIGLGWSPIPLPAGKKWPPPNGITGWRGRYTTVTDLEHFDWSGNIAIRLPSDVIGIDIDVYDGGDASLAGLEERLGGLPPTRWSTSRTDGSGIGLFRVPVGTVLVTDPAKGIDIIQAHHRYVVCAPSIHPKTGQQYRWLDEADDDYVDDPGEPGDLPDLPWAWIAGLASEKTGAANAATPAAADAFIAAHMSSTRPAALKGVRSSLTDVTVGGRHDALVTAACWAMREAAAGLYPAEEAVAALHGWWLTVMADEPQRREGGEFGGAILWGIGQAEADTDRVTQIRHTAPTGVNPDTGEILERDDPLDDKFWQTRQVLAHIRQAAHSRTRSAPAALGVVLARVATMVPHSVTLPASVGAPAPLNLLINLVARSGGGKTTTAEIGRELVPIDDPDILTDVPIGSGEGLSESFLGFVTEEQPDGKSVKVRRQVRHSLMVYIDEGQVLSELGGRKGATLLPTLRTAWSGGVLGQANASLETYRRIEAHSYRLTAIIAVQYVQARGILADAAGGTPQRMLWFAATDSTIPDDPPEWPGELPWQPYDRVYFHGHIQIPVNIGDEVRQRGLIQARGEATGDELDAHRDQLRLRVAALFGIIDGRNDIDDEDWWLAGRVLEHSIAVRSSIIQLARLDAVAEEDAAIARHIRREHRVADSTERKALESAAWSAARRVAGADKPVNRSELTRAMAGKHRQLVTVDAVIDHAESKEWIVWSDDGWTIGKGYAK